MDVILTNQFKRDCKLMRNRGYDMKKLDETLTLLETGRQLPAKYRAHKYCKGTPYIGCHIQPDWVLIYEQRKDRVVMIRTATHSDLFLKNRALPGRWRC